MAVMRDSGILQIVLSGLAERRFLAVSGLLFAGAVAGTIGNSTSMSGTGDMCMPGGWTMSMPSIPKPGESLLSGAVVFLVMWLLMTMAMMGPSFLPVLWRYRQDLRTTGDGLIDRPTALVALGYFFVWSLVGIGVFAVRSVISLAEMQHAPIAQAVPLAGGGVVLAAGLLQLTGWKTHRLACCGELHWRSRTSARALSPWRVGIRIGVRCCFCCANLMAVLLVIGMMDLLAMALMTVAVSLERLAPRGAQFARAVGIIVIAGGLMMIGRSLG